MDERVETVAMVTLAERRRAMNRSDPRFMRTYVALVDALSELRRVRPLPEISVSALCERAEVHRTTFYGHYLDVFALAIDVAAPHIDELAHPWAVVDTSAAAGELEQVLTRIRDNRPAWQLLFEDSNYTRFRPTLHARIRETLTAHVEISQLPPADMVTAYTAGAIVGTLEYWTYSQKRDAGTGAATINTLIATLPARAVLRFTSAG